MRLLNEEITEEFLERLVDDSVMRLEAALASLDVSMDYIAALLGDRPGVEISQRQKTMGRMMPARASDRPVVRPKGKQGDE
jgi:hypothetical protein